MAGDWVKLHRKIVDSRVMSDHKLLAIWVWCLCRANYKTRYFQGQEIRPGQFVTGRNTGAAEVGVSPSAFYRGLRKLEEWNQITLKANSQWTTVTICNWQTYQSDDEPERTASGQPADSQRTAGEQRADNERTQEKKVKKVKKEKKSGEAAFFDPLRIDIPEGLDTPAFREAWGLWCDHRAEKRKKLTPTSVGQQMKRFAEWGERRSIAAIEFTIEKGWEGIREPEPNTRSPPPKVTMRLPTEEELANWNPITGGLGDG